MIGRIVDHRAPAERLAAFRIVVGVFVVAYLVGRSPVFLALADRPPDDFDPVGLLAPFGQPPPGSIVTGAFAITFVAGVCATFGYRYRPAAILFAVGMLFLATLRSSWGQLLHFENLMGLQLIVLAASPAADTWSLDRRRRTPLRDGASNRGRGGSDEQRGSEPSSHEHSDDEPCIGGSSIGEPRQGEPMTAESSTRYGWPLAVASLVMVATYVIAGLAKLRYGGIEWITGDTLRNHIAYSAARLDIIGGTPPFLAGFVVRHAPALPVFAFLAVAVELSAPVVFVGSRWRNVWVASAWLMHIGILLTMSVGFPSPLFGVAFAPLFPLERVVHSLRHRFDGHRSDLSTPTP